MSDSYAIYFSSDDCTHIALIKTFTTLLKQLTITSFLFVPCAHNILLDYFASDHTLPKIARGSIDPLKVLKDFHPLKLFQLYQTCVLGYFTLDQFEFFSFNINTFGVLLHNKIKTIFFSFLNYQYLRTLAMGVFFLITLRGASGRSHHSHVHVASIPNISLSIL